MAGVSDPYWWIEDDTGFKVTYLLSAHIHTAPRWPGTKVLHVVAGPLRLVLSWQERKPTWVGPNMACFAFVVFAFQDEMMMGRFGWAAVWLLLMFSYAMNIARETVRP